MGVSVIDSGEDVKMRNTKRKAKIRRLRRNQERHDRAAPRRMQPIPRAIAPAVEGVPPTDNLRKHPDAAYGDTEIPDRGAQLDKLKRESQ